MTKKFIFSFLLLLTLAPSLQARSDTIKINLADQEVASFCGFYGAWGIAIATFILSARATQDFDLGLLSSLVGVVLYGIASREMAQSDDVRKQSFGRSGATGACFAGLQLAAILALFYPFK